MSGANERLGIGIDVGGSSIKAGLADLASGRLVGDRLSVPTPRPAAPRSVVEAIVGLVRELDAVRPGAEPVGVGVPCVVVRGVTRTAANIDPAWIGFPAARGLSEAVGRPVTVVNDADAAGVAEMRFGAGRGRDGVVILLTLGTGVGSAIFTDGRLVPNSELGHLPLHGDSAEKRTAAVVRVREKLSWEEYAARLTEHLTLIERLLWPELFIVGGGIVENADRFVPLLGCTTPVIPATLGNDAGSVGAALFAAHGPG